MAVVDMEEFNDNALPDRLFPIIKSLSESANSVESLPSTVQALGIELDGIDTRLVSAEQGVANAGGRLAGDDNYFEGTGTFTGTPSGLLISSLSVISAQGIDYNAGYFNFSYLGKYLVHVTQLGDCINVRSDWYQEVSIGIKDVVSGVTVPLTFARIPPSGTWNLENSGVNVIGVVGGSQWKPRINMTINGSTTNGSFKIKIKKVI